MSESRPENPRPKRRRIVNPTHQACSACKARKVRCDAGRPQCSACASISKDCVYPPVYRRANCSQEHVDELEAKLQECERLLAINQQYIPSRDDFHHKTQQIQQSVVQDHFQLGSAQPGRRIAPRVRADGTGPMFGFDRPVAGDADNSRPHVIDAVNQAAELQHANEEVQSDGMEHQQSSEERFDSPECLSPIVSDDDDNPEDEAIPVMDGMVEYAQPSPSGSHVADAFEDSSTFNFALSMTAYKNEGGTIAPEQLCGISPRHDLSAIDNLSTSHAAEQKGQKIDNDVIVALKSYISQSSMEYLPQRHVATQLLQKYFTLIHPVWPFLIEESTRAAFDKTWTSNDIPSPVWIAQLNLIFALACQLWKSNEDAPLGNIYEAGRQFYLRASGFIIANSHSICSIPMVQTLLLAAQYQQGTMRANECWLTIGNVTRMALGLGLHTIDETNTSLAPLDKELCKRLWWGCFSLDRVSSIVYGRPVGIPYMGQPANNAILPSPVDDKFIAAGESQPAGTLSVNAFFVSVVKLYCVMDEILESLHHTSSADRTHSRTPFSQSNPLISGSCTYCAISQLPAILKLDALLLEWHNELPPHLKFSRDSLDDLTLLPLIQQRQKIILKTRFLGMRILLHRRSVLFLLQTPDTRKWPRDTSRRWPHLHTGTSGMAASVDNNTSCSKSRHSPPIEAELACISAKICVRMAQQQIDMIDSSRPLGLSGAWWWDFHFVFNSLCVLFAAVGVQKPELNAIVPDLNGNKSIIRRGFHNIHEMALRGGPKVAQSEKFLRHLLKSMTQCARKPLLRPEDENVVKPPNDQSLLPSTTSRKDPRTNPGLREEPNNNQPLNLDLNMIADGDPSFVDAFEFLMGDQVTLSYPRMENMFDWGGPPSNVEGGSTYPYSQGFV